MAEDKKAAAAAAERAADEKKASLTGAEAVAAAVSKVANAAVDEIKKTPASAFSPDLVAVGIPGGKFRIVGTGFSASGTVMLNGGALRANAWSTTEIEGWLPADAKSGEITVVVDADTVRRGYLKV